MPSTEPECLGSGTKKDPLHYVVDERVSEAIRSGNWDVIMLSAAADELDRLMEFERTARKLLEQSDRYIDQVDRQLDKLYSVLTSRVPVGFRLEVRRILDDKESQ